MSSKYLIIQNRPNSIKSESILNIDSIINKYFDNSINFIILPECWNCPIEKQIEKYAEEFAVNIESPSIQYLYELSKSKPHVYIISGGIYEKNESGYYKTCSVWQAGVMIYNYKTLPVLTPDIKPTYFDTEYGRIGLVNSLEHDLKIPENKVNTVIFFDFLSGYYSDSKILKQLAIKSKCSIVASSTTLNRCGHSMVINSSGCTISDDIGNTENIIITKL